jgi:predicted transposase YbfD/YdcC
MSNRWFTRQKAKNFADSEIAQTTTIDGGHGRIATQTITVIHDVEWLRKRHDRPGLNAAAIVESTREIGDEIQRETRFYITSLVMLAHLPGPVIRSHWAIENSLHRVMDMVFRDDKWRVRTNHAPRTSPASNIWRITCSGGLPASIHFVFGASSSRETRSSSPASSPHENFTRFAWPSFKLAGEARDRVKIKKTYHSPVTPFQRLLADMRPSKDVLGRVNAIYAILDPVLLLREIRAAQELLVEIADRPGTAEATTPTRRAIARFFSGLHTARREGEAHPTNKAKAKAPRGRRRPARS